MQCRKSFFKYFSLLLVICIVFSGCAENQELSEKERPPVTIPATAIPSETLPKEPAETQPEETQPEETQLPETRPKRTVQELSVAVYPFIPNVDFFQEVLLEKWAELEPDVALTMEQWDSYGGLNDSDVLMYDAVVLSYLVENGCLLPIAPEEMDNPQGIIPFALDGAFHKGRYYGMPFFICGEFLIYYKSDTEMDKVDNMVKLASVVQERREKNPNTGVVVSNDYVGAYHYLDAWIDMRGEYSLYEQLPDCNNLDQRVLWYIDKVQAATINLPWQKLEAMSKEELFSQGNGFAYFGYSEGMSGMHAVVDKLAIKKLSFTENIDIPLLYLDLISVASHVTDPEKLELCKELVNLVASEEFQKELCLAKGEPQYLLPARESVYLAVEREYPMYGQLREIVMDPCNRAFRAGADFYQYKQYFPN